MAKPMATSIYGCGSNNNMMVTHGYSSCMTSSVMAVPKLETRIKEKLEEWYAELAAPSSDPVLFMLDRIARIEIAIEDLIGRR